MTAFDNQWSIVAYAAMTFVGAIVLVLQGPCALPIIARSEDRRQNRAALVSTRNQVAQGN